MNKEKRNILAATFPSNFFLDENTKLVTRLIQKIADEIISESDLQETGVCFDENMDETDSWYSFVISLDATLQDVDLLNEKFVRKFLENDELSELNMKLKIPVVFRFKIGVSKCR